MVSVFVGDKVRGPGEAIKRWSRQLEAYALAQHPNAQRLRARQMPSPPWPSAGENHMLCYLLDRTDETVQVYDWPTAAIWLASHAWFEGSLAAVDMLAAGKLIDPGN